MGELFFAPRRFFSHRPLDRGSAFAAFVAGMTAKIIQARDHVPASDASFAGILFFCLQVLLAGMIGGFLFWIVAGWWYRTRLDWSAARAPDSRLARQVNAWQTFVWAAPTLLSTLVVAFIPRSEREPWMWIAVPTLFYILSCFTSTIAAVTAFRAAPRHAAVWFALLPLLLYAIGIARFLFS